MSIQRSIIHRLFESKGLYESEFMSGGSKYNCAFGKYYKDGEEISREEYFKAKPRGDTSDSTDPQEEQPTVHDERTEGDLDSRASELFNKPWMPPSEDSEMSRYKNIKDPNEKRAFLDVAEKLSDLDDVDPRIEGLYTDYISTGSPSALRKVYDYFNKR